MQISLLLKQHVGAPCKPLVEPGQRVERGQKVAAPDGLGANIHASVSGTVEAVNETAIVIRAEGPQEKGYLPIPRTGSHLEDIREAGIVGAGGAGFPTYVKLQNSIPGGVVIANAAECEPVLEHNIRYIEENPCVVAAGLRYAMEIVGAVRGIIAIKVKNMQAIKALSPVVSRMDGVEIKILPDLYPSGDERVVIRELLGHELEPGALPSTVDALVLNVETLKNIALAIDERKPVIDKDITVAGRVGAKEKVLFDVPIGTEVNACVEQAGGYIEPHGELLLGGPFTGKRGEPASPVSKMLGGIIVTMPFPRDDRAFGILACECGAQEERLTQLVSSMGGTVVASEKCKRMTEVNGRFRCEKPGVCPGQAQTVLALKKAGAQAIMAGSCSD